MNRLFKYSQTAINISYKHCNQHILSQSIRNIRSPISKEFAIRKAPVRKCHYQQVKLNEKIVGTWFITCGGMVYLAVVLGGVTRLTESGLSMVNWKLLGEHIPRTDLDWKNEFENYQKYPEFRMAIQLYKIQYTVQRG